MKQQKEIVEKVVNYIEDNIKSEISVDIIAKNIGYSKFYLNRIFSERTGITIYKYLQSRRLTIAAEKLIKTNEPITEIAYEAGYDSQQAFSLAFKQLYVYPPVNVNIKMIKKWKIKMYIFQDLFLSLCFHKGSFFF